MKWYMFIFGVCFAWTVMVIWPNSIPGVKVTPSECSTCEVMERAELDALHVGPDECDDRVTTAVQGIHMECKEASGCDCVQANRDIKKMDMCFQQLRDSWKATSTWRDLAELCHNVHLEGERLKRSGTKNYRREDDDQHNAHCRNAFHYARARPERMRSGHF